MVFHSPLGMHWPVQRRSRLPAASPGAAAPPESPRQDLPEAGGGQRLWFYLSDARAAQPSPTAAHLLLTVTPVSLSESTLFPYHASQACFSHAGRTRGTRRKPCLVPRVSNQSCHREVGRLLSRMDRLCRIPETYP